MTIIVIISIIIIYFWLVPSLFLIPPFQQFYSRYHHLLIYSSILFNLHLIHALKSMFIAYIFIGIVDYIQLLIHWAFQYTYISCIHEQYHHHLHHHHFHQFNQGIHLYDDAYRYHLNTRIMILFMILSRFKGWSDTSYGGLRERLHWSC